MRRGGGAGAAHMLTVHREWAARIQAERNSAVITAHLVRLLIEHGLSRAVIAAGQVIVEDELTHSALAQEVLRDAGARPFSVVEVSGVESYASLSSARQALLITGGVFCCGETAAVPLFLRMYQGATQKSAKAALKRILKDEGRHRAFGWSVLPKLLAKLPLKDRSWFRQQVPGFVRSVADAYRAPPRELTEAERAWGLIAPQDYAAAVEQAQTRVMVPRFRAAGLWPARAG